MAFNPIYEAIKMLGNTVFPIQPNGNAFTKSPTRSVLGDALASQVYQPPTGTPISPIAGAMTTGDSPVQQAMAQQVSAQNVSAPIPTPQVPKSAFSDFTTTDVPSNLQPLIYKSAMNAGVDPNVFASLLFSEHGLQTTPGINRNADGSYDRGIAQINTKQHPEVTDQQALDPNFAIPYAANLLGNHIKNLGDINKGIAAYNVGEGGATANQGGVGPMGQAYIDKIANGLSPSLLKKLGIKKSNSN